MRQFVTACCNATLPQYCHPHTVRVTHLGVRCANQLKTPQVSQELKLVRQLVQAPMLWSTGPPPATVCGTSRRSSRDSHASGCSARSAGSPQRSRRLYFACPVWPSPQVQRSKGRSWLGDCDGDLRQGPAGLADDSRHRRWVSGRQSPYPGGCATAAVVRWLARKLCHML